jgi:hypothetical protein
LAEARRALASERARRGSDRVAGHFGLRFRRSQPGASFAYFFFECKAGLNRPGCVNGDQGFWLSRRYLDELGGFDEGAPFFEDARLAARVFADGAWVTLPGWLSTSARRFEAEGLGKRQTLNAILRAADHLGLRDFFGGAAGAYREQSGAGSLDLLPFLKLAHRGLWRNGVREGLRYWRRAGDYSASQAWQAAFWMDCRRGFLRGGSPHDLPHPFLDAFERHGPRLLGNPLARAASSVLVALWFYSLFGWLRVAGAAKHRVNNLR